MSPVSQDQIIYENIKNIIKGTLHISPESEILTNNKNKEKVYHYVDITDCPCCLNKNSILDEIHHRNSYRRNRTLYIDKQFINKLLEEKLIFNVIGSIKEHKVSELEDNGQFVTKKFIERHSLGELGTKEGYYLASNYGYYRWSQTNSGKFYPFREVYRNASYHSDLKRMFMFFNGFYYESFSTLPELLNNIAKLYHSLNKNKKSGKWTKTDENRYMYYKDIFTKMEQEKPIMFAGMEVEQVDNRFMVLDDLMEGKKPLSPEEKYSKFKLITENDGSVPNNGGETIISCMPYEHITKYIKHYNKLIFGKNGNVGSVSDEKKCGGHINISTAYYSNNTDKFYITSIKDILLNMQLKNIAYLLALYKITRGENSYCKYRISTDKYSAVHIRNKFIEFRMFPICHDSIEAEERLTLINKIICQENEEDIINYIINMKDFNQHCLINKQVQDVNIKINHLKEIKSNVEKMIATSFLYYTEN